MTFSEDGKEYRNYPPQFRHDGTEFIQLLTGGKGKRQEWHIWLVKCSHNAPQNYHLFWSLHYQMWTTKTLPPVFYSLGISWVIYA